MFVSVEFISDKSGEYGGVEYPPSPSRFVQAIIAGTHGDSKYFPVLHHLETIAPQIYATPEFSSYDYETYVPKNSWDSGRGQSLQQRNTSTRKQVKTRLFHSSRAHVIYEYDVPQELRDLFTEAVKSVTVLGRAMDIVLVNVHDTMPAGDFDVFVPDAINARGTQVYLHTPVIGFVDSVFKKYVNKVKTLTVEDRGYTRNPQRRSPVPCLS